MKTDDKRLTKARALSRAAAHYANLAEARADASSKLACLVLSDYCSDDYGGPSEEMVALSEQILGEQFDKVIEGFVALENVRGVAIRDLDWHLVGTSALGVVIRNQIAETIADEIITGAKHTTSATPHEDERGTAAALESAHENVRGIAISALDRHLTIGVVIRNRIAETIAAIAGMHLQAFCVPTQSVST
jgi:hypothetical protein